MYTLSLIATTIEMVVCLLCARQLRRTEKISRGKSRWLLTLGCLCSGLLSAFVLLANMGMETSASEPLLLEPWIGLVYMSMHIVMTLYPITVVRGDWLTPRHYFFMFLPVAFFTLVYLFFIGRWTPLPTPASVWENYWKPDVLVRLASLFVMAPYCLILLWLPYNYKKSSATVKWIVNYSFGLTLLCSVHIVLMLTYSPLLMCIIPLLASAFYLLSTEYEIRDRLRPSQEVEEEPDEEEEDEVEVIPVKEELLPTEFGLWSRISHIMDKEEAWRDPDLSLSSLARRAGTNTTYLNRVINQETGGGFKEYIISKRIDSVVEQLKKDPMLDVQVAFFNAGFRSRTTAWRNFKELMGVTPSEFRQSIK